MSSIYARSDMLSDGVLVDEFVDNCVTSYNLESGDCACIFHSEKRQIGCLSGWNELHLYWKVVSKIFGIRQMCAVSNPLGLTMT